MREGTCPHVTEKLFVQIAAFKLGKLVVIVLEKKMIYTHKNWWLFSENMILSFIFRTYLIL